MEFREAKLPNGLSVVAEINPDAYSTALGMFVNAGSRDEEAAISGVSHFLEHMMFKGTSRRSAWEINRDLDELGSSSNAYTSQEQTVYYGTVLPEYQLRLADLLLDMMQPALREDDFNTEKQVIIEEIRMYDDQPPYGGHDRLMALHFGSHPLGQSILGTADSVSGLTPEAMRAYFQSHYSPNHLSLVGAGNVDFDALVKLAEEQSADWLPQESTRKHAPVITGNRLENLEVESSTQQYVMQLAGAPSAADPLRYASRLLSVVVGDDSGSRLFWELAEKGLADYAGLSTEEFDDVGLWGSYLICAPEMAAENLARMAEVYAEVEKNGITEDELERARTKLTASIIRQGERPIHRMFAVGSNWAQLGVYRSEDEVLAAYHAVKTSDMPGLLEQFPLTSGLSTVSVGPLKSLQLPESLVS